MTSTIEELKFSFYFILISLNVNLSSHMWFVATVVDWAVSPWVRGNRIKNMNKQIPVGKTTFV